MADELGAAILRAQAQRQQERKIQRKAATRHVCFNR
jgi:hypothetical protein